MVNLVKSGTVHLSWMLLIRSIHFTWEDLVHLVIRGVSLFTECDLTVVDSKSESSFTTASAKLPS